MSEKTCFYVSFFARKFYSLCSGFTSIGFDTLYSSAFRFAFFIYFIFFFVCASACVCVAFSYLIIYLFFYSFVFFTSFFLCSTFIHFVRRFVVGLFVRGFVTFLLCGKCICVSCVIFFSSSSFIASNLQTSTHTKSASERESLLLLVSVLPFLFVTHLQIQLDLLLFSAFTYSSALLHVQNTFQKPISFVSNTPPAAVNI